jgi:hypothetical protein
LNEEGQMKARKHTIDLERRAKIFQIKSKAMMIGMEAPIRNARSKG